MRNHSVAAQLKLTIIHLGTEKRQIKTDLGAKLGYNQSTTIRQKQRECISVGIRSLV